MCYINFSNSGATVSTITLRNDLWIFFFFIIFSIWELFRLLAPSVWKPGEKWDLNANRAWKFYIRVLHQQRWKWTLPRLVFSLVLLSSSWFAPEGKREGGKGHGSSVYIPNQSASDMHQKTDKNPNTKVPTIKLPSLFIIPSPLKAPSKIWARLVEQLFLFYFLSPVSSLYFLDFLSFR